MTGSVLEAPPHEALELSEAVSLFIEEGASLLPDDRFQPEPGSVFDAQGRVPIIVIRPGIGKGRGRHLYEAEMLRENAHKFRGWKMFVDHQSPEARRAAGGLPRSIRDLGGRIEESWWEDGIPSTDEHGPGAVVGLARPVPFVRELIEADPEIIESSISAEATGVRPVVHGGQRAWLVEGIEDRGSVDWVTEAGAGGRVIPLMEAAYSTEEDVDRALLESMSGGELASYLEDRRPDLLEAMKKKGKPDPSEGGDELAKKTEELEKKGMPRAMAAKAARKALSEANDNPEGGDVADITPEALQEAVAASPDILIEALQQSSEAQLFITGLVEAKLEEEREVIEKQAGDKATRIVQLASFEREAHRTISEAKLPETWAEGLRSRYSLQESGEPTEALDVLDTVADDGTVEKAAKEKLAEALEEDIKTERKRLAEANPTRVRGQRPSSEDDTNSGNGELKSLKDTGYGRFLQESAGVDPDEAFALKGAGDDE